MPKESCPNCATKMPEPVSFCPTCDRPTRHASDAERLDWDLRQWRTHVDKSVAAGVTQGAEVLRARGGVIVASAEKTLAPVARPAMVESRLGSVAQRVVAAPAAKAPTGAPTHPGAEAPRRRPYRARIAKLRIPRPRLPRRNERKEPDVVIDLDADNAFAYRACATCQATDWIVRTNRNDDETWNYWCIRCSRTFKTENKLRHAVKPFLSAGVVVGGLIAASVVLLH
jgi:hypothetical protein